MFSFEIIPKKARMTAWNTAQAIANINRVLVAAHINPDGDALGAMAACGWILKNLDKQFVIYTPGPLPQYLQFLTLPGPVFHSLDDLPFAPQAAIYLDCSVSHRLGPELAGQAQKWPTINIDHHLCETGLGSLANFIYPEAAASCQLMAYIAICLKQQLKDGLGEAIGLGLITDTGHFSHANTSAQVFELAAQLEQNGVQLWKIWQELQNNFSLNGMHLWGKLFGRAALAENGKVVWASLPLALAQEYDCQNDSTESFVDCLRRIRGSEISLFIREIDADGCRFSLRSIETVNVQEIAASLGGGGHKNAAGGFIKAPLAVAEQKLLAAIREWLNARS